MKTLLDIYAEGYRLRIGHGAWTLFHGQQYHSRVVASGKLNFNVPISTELTVNGTQCADQIAIQEVIDMANADFVKGRIIGSIKN